MTRNVDLDHVAIAAFDITPTLNALVGGSGARVLFGGINHGFRAMQLDCGDLRVELLEPWNTQANDFMKRFLDAHGEGPHHLTFKTDDIRRDLEYFNEAGYHPVGINIDNPFWQEAFLHPKEAGGTVVQIAQSEIDPMAIDPSLIPEDMRDLGPAQWWPDPPRASETRAILRKVVVTTDEMNRTLDLYRELLGGTNAGFGEGWVELAWPSGGRIRVEAAAGRSEGIDRLLWSYPGPLATRTVGGTRFVLYPESSSGGS